MGIEPSRYIHEMNTHRRNEPYLRMSRRSAVKWFMVAGLSASFRPGRLGAASPMGKDAGARGYGRDPNMFEGEVPWPRTLSDVQLQTVAVLADVVLPYTSEASPAASTLHVPDFIDEWVSAPYPRQRRDREVILAGIARVDVLSIAQWERPFPELSADQQEALCRALAGDVDKPEVTTSDRSFFRQFTLLVLGGYYTTEVGLAEIGYVGNVPLPSFPGPPPEVLRRIGVEQTPW